MIIPYTKTNKAGQKINYWTHSSYLDDEPIQKITESLNFSRTVRNYIGLAGVIVGLKASTLPSITKLVPSKLQHPLAVPLIAGGAFFAVAHLILVAGKGQKQLTNLLNNSTIPLWTNKKNVINLDRAFFHLDQSKNNKLDLLYHGLTADAAARIYPDAISGPAPKAPADDHHDHHDGHGHHDEHGHDQGHKHEHKQEKHH